MADVATTAPPSPFSGDREPPDRGHPPHWCKHPEAAWAGGVQVPHRRAQPVPPLPTAEPQTHPALADGARVPPPFGAIGVRPPVRICAVRGAEPQLQPLNLQQNKHVSRLLGGGGGLSSATPAPPAQRGRFGPETSGTALGEPCHVGHQGQGLPRTAAPGKEQNHGGDGRGSTGPCGNILHRDSQTWTAPTGHHPEPQASQGDPPVPLLRLPTRTASAWLDVLLAVPGGPGSPQDSHLIYRSQSGVSAEGTKARDPHREWTQPGTATAGSTCRGDLSDQGRGAEMGFNTQKPRVLLAGNALHLPRVAAADHRAASRLRDHTASLVQATSPCGPGPERRLPWPGCGRVPAGAPKRAASCTPALISTDLGIPRPQSRLPSREGRRTPEAAWAAAMGQQGGWGSGGLSLAAADRSSRRKLRDRPCQHPPGDEDGAHLREPGLALQSQSRLRMPSPPPPGVRAEFLSASLNTRRPCPASGPALACRVRSGEDHTGVIPSRSWEKPRRGSQVCGGGSGGHRGGARGRRGRDRWAWSAGPADSEGGAGGADSWLTSGPPVPFPPLLPLTHPQNDPSSLHGTQLCTPRGHRPPSRPGVTVSRTHSTHLSRAESPGGLVPHSLAVSLAVGEGRGASLLEPQAPPSAWHPRSSPPGLLSLCPHTPAGRPPRPELLLGEEPSGETLSAAAPHIWGTRPQNACWPRPGDKG